MENRSIQTDREYEAALREIEQLYDAEAGTLEGDRMEILSILVEAYEDEHYDIPVPDPVEAILYYTESRGLAIRSLIK